MSKEEDPRQEDLSELEAALAAMAPRADRLNRDRLMFLAGQASVESTHGAGFQGAVNSADWQSAPHPHFRQVGNLPHVAAWPAAFATMTAIAAALLVALVIRPAPRVVERIVERIATVPTLPQEPAAAVAQNRVEPDASINSPTTSVAVPDWLAWGLIPQAAVNTKQEPSYVELRNQVLSHGLNSWEPPASASAAAGGAEEEPVSSREQLKRWLEQERADGASRRVSPPVLRNLSGARS